MAEIERLEKREREREREGERERESLWVSKLTRLCGTNNKTIKKKQPTLNFCCRSFPCISLRSNPCTMFSPYSIDTCRRSICRTTKWLVAWTLCRPHTPGTGDWRRRCCTSMHPWPAGHILPGTPCTHSQGSSFRSRWCLRTVHLGRDYTPGRRENREIGRSGDRVGEREKRERKKQVHVEARELLSEEKKENDKTRSETHLDQQSIAIVRLDRTCESKLVAIHSGIALSAII